MTRWTLLGSIPIFVLAAACSSGEDEPGAEDTEHNCNLYSHEFLLAGWLEGRMVDRLSIARQRALFHCHAIIIRI